MIVLRRSRFVFLIFIIWYTPDLYSQDKISQLPVTVLAGRDTTLPLILYISGDGGWNKFSSSFMDTMNKKGYPVVGLNAREYFWHKKDAAGTANDVVYLTSFYMNTMKLKKVVMIGYSMGADVMPFIVTRCKYEIRDKLKYVVLMSPSATTDFEVHIADILGIGNESGESVAAEINKISQPILIVFGQNENTFPLKAITIKNYKVNRLPGGHHYDGNPAAVCDLILPYIR